MYSTRVSLKKVRIAKLFFLFSSRNKGHLCKEICDAVVPFIIASFIIGTLVSIGYIILSVNGMQREIELLKIQLFKGISNME